MQLIWSLCVMVSVIIVAAGSSSRMNGVNKQLETIGGIPVFVMSALKFERSEKVGEIIIAAPGDDAERYEKLAREHGVSKLTAVIAGGETRMQSVRNCLGAVSPEADYIAIHDGARPLIETGEIERVFADAEKYGAAITAVPAVDTIKEVGSGGFIGNHPGFSSVITIYGVNREKIISVDTAHEGEKNTSIIELQSSSRRGESTIAFHCLWCSQIGCENLFCNIFGVAPCKPVVMATF